MAFLSALMAWAPAAHHAHPAFAHPAYTAQLRVHTAPKALYAEHHKSVVVHRASPPLHVHTAAHFLRLLTDFFNDLARRAREPPAHYRSRTREPLFVEGALCEIIHDEEGGYSFYVCSDPVDAPSYTCRRVEREGRWVFYCSKIVRGALSPPPLFAHLFQQEHDTA